MARLLISVTLVACLAAAVPWDSANDPNLLNPDNQPLQLTLSALPTSGSTANKPWSDTYWPSFESGVAHRWNSDNPQDFSYSLNTLAQLAAMTQDQIAQLSPAEKLDIFNQRYDYPFVKSEWKRCHANDPEWEGICHGWSPAALFYEQPDAVTLTSADNITIPFGASDVKALLSYYVGQYDDQEVSQFVGQRCNLEISNNDTAANTPECADMNAGTYHAIMANLLGIRQRGMVVDRERGLQVWNQPVWSFSTTVTNLSNVLAQVHTDMSYAKETEPAWRKHDPYIVTESYDYTVDLDANGIIVGGTMNSYDRVDFAWNDKVDPFYGYFANLQTIYQASINSSAPLRKAASAPHHRRNHQNLRAADGTFVLPAYTRGHRASWTIHSPSANGIRITFPAFETERFRDTVRIYEDDGNGALVAVLHGDQTPEPVVVNGQSAYVVFRADPSSRGYGGFMAEFSSF